MHLRKNNILFSLIGIVAFFSLLTFVDAATLQVVPIGSAYHVGDTIRLKVAVTSDTQSINGASVSIKYPTDMLGLSSISKNDSIMTLWAQEPTYSNSAGTAKFEAVALSGFTGQNGTLVTFVFKAKKAGKATVSITDGTVLANNGEGTNVLTTKSGTTITIGEAVVAPADQPKLPEDSTTSSTETAITIQEIKKEDTRSPQAAFLVTTTDQNPNQSYDIQIDDMPVITWVDDGVHIFRTPVLARGTHLIRFKTVTNAGIMISAFSEFTTDNLIAPVITDYPVNVFAGEYIVLKGIADPETTIVFTTTKVPGKIPFFSRITGVQEDTKPVESSVISNDKGEFSYISPDKVTAGTYSIYARSQSSGGLQSAPTLPVRISVHDDIFSRLTLWLTNTLSLIVPLAALLFVFFFMIIYTLAKYRRFKKRLVADLLVSESNVRKGFQAIDADLEDYAKLLLKSRTSSHLTDAERETLMRIKQDITVTEKSISGDIKRTQEKLLQ